MSLFESDKDKQLEVSSFTNLMNSPGWKLIVEILDENISIVTKQILSGSDEENQVNMDRLRDKLRVYEEVKDTPKLMIKALEAPSSNPVKIDPYQTVEELKKERNKS